MTKKKNQLTRDQAVEQLWRKGILDWKLNSVQQEIKKMVDTDDSKTSVVVLSRRTGKTYWLVIEALSQCIRQPNSIVKFIFPHQKDAKINIHPLIGMITEDCPEDLKPVFSTQEKIYHFFNGSQIQLAAAANGNAESIRGGFAHLCILDETGFIQDLSYIVRSILSPTIRTTGGRIIMASTPSRSPDHEFITEFMMPYKASGRLKIFTIYDNPNFTSEIIEEIIADYPRGVEDPDFRREYLCEVAIDTETAICPEFSINKDKIVFNDEDEVPIPEFLDFYVGADIGYRDLTVMLFGYYDFKEACLVILDELVMNGPEMTTDRLATNIRKKELLRFYQSEMNVDPYLRVMDNDLKLINDLRKLHNIGFIPTRKDNKEGAINEMKIWMSQGRVKIHERCKHLIYHLEYGQWNNKRNDFKRLADTLDGEIRGGHVDAIPALYYLIRNIHTHRNPFPENYGLNLNGEDRHVSPKWKGKQRSEGAEFMRNLFNLKKRR